MKFPDPKRPSSLERVGDFEVTQATSIPRPTSSAYAHVVWRLLYLPASSITSDAVNIMQSACAPYAEGQECRSQPSPKAFTKSCQRHRSGPKSKLFMLDGLLSTLDLPFDRILLSMTVYQHLPMASALQQKRFTALFPA